MSLYTKWRCGRRYVAITRVAAVMVKQPDTCHHLDPLHRTAGLRSKRARQALDWLIAAGHVEQGPGGATCYTLTAQGLHDWAASQVLP